MNIDERSTVVLTADGSHSVYNPAVGVQYHSIFGALQEANIVFIRLGLEAAFALFPGLIRVFEMGFGTGLNALLTAQAAEKAGREVHYVTVETQPLPTDVARQLNYDTLLGTTLLNDLHDAPDGQPIRITPNFTLEKHYVALQTYRPDTLFDVVYYDAFAPRSQPELWTEETFGHVATLLRPGGLLTTYCAKGYVQRNLRAAGFTVERHPGPARKREVIRAVRQ